MAFSPDFLDEIRLRLPLSGVVGRRVKLVRRGREHSGLCPFHNEKTPSFTVSDDKGFFHCFGCGKHGDVIGFVMDSEGLSFPEAVERLAGEAGLEVPRASPEEQARAARRAGLVEVLEAATRWFEANLASPQGARARDYLDGRGLAPETVKAFRLGFAPAERGRLTQALKAQGIGRDQLIEGGLVKPPEDGGEPRDYFFDRIIFPIRDRKGRVIAFGGRALGDSPAKYLNSPETPLFHKGRVLYNLDKARKAAHDNHELVVVEGYMDVIALAQAGFPAAVAPLGTAVTEDQIGELWRLAREPVLCLDGDSAGQRAAFRALGRALPILKPGNSLKFATLPVGEDPDSLLRAQGPLALRAVLGAARPLVEVLWQRETDGKPVDTPERRTALRAGLRAAAGEIRHPELREEYLAEMVGRFEALCGYRPAADRRFRRGDRGFAAGRHRTRDRDRDTDSPFLRERLGARQSPDLLRRRQEQVLLATMINHPQVLFDYQEDLAGVVFSDAGLEACRGRIVDFHAETIAAGAPGPVGSAKGPESQDELMRGAALDSDAMKCHLSEQGFSAVLKNVLSPEVYIHGTFARPDATAEAARGGLRHVLTLFHQRRSASEQEEAELRFAADPSEENLARLRAVQKLNQEGETKMADLDQLEAAGSGNGN
jgi:DNA primase